VKAAVAYLPDSDWSWTGTCGPEGLGRGKERQLADVLGAGKQRPPLGSAGRPSEPIRQTRGPGLTTTLGEAAAANERTAERNIVKQEGRGRAVKDGRGGGRVGC
jgi:hypothetical protein